jgi:hypothetical protein
LATLMKRKPLWAKSWLSYTLYDIILPHCPLVYSVCMQTICRGPVFVEISIYGNANNFAATVVNPQFCTELRHVMSVGHLWVMAGRLVRILVGNPSRGFGYLSPQVIEDPDFNSGTSYSPQVPVSLCNYFWHHSE